MVEKERKARYQPFRPGEMEQARKGEIPHLPPLSPRQQEVFDLSLRY